MSLLVHYTLASPDDHDAQITAMRALVADLRAEAIEGIRYSCFETADPTRFVGLLEFPDDRAKEAFMASDALATYRAAAGPLFANPPEPQPITPIASTDG